MNYTFINWSRFMGPHTVTLEARLGVGCGVGDYNDHQRLFAQDLFLYYLGYFTAEYRYNRTHFGLHASVTPIWNESVANALVELEWHFREGWPWLMLQYHYGFDETMCSCVRGGGGAADEREDRTVLPVREAIVSNIVSEGKSILSFRKRQVRLLSNWTFRKRPYSHLRDENSGI